MSLFSLVYHGFFKVSLLALVTLGLVRTVPLPEDLSKGRAAMCVLLEGPLQPIRLLTKALMVEILLHLILRRKQILLSHELGHSLASYHMETQLREQSSRDSSSAEKSEAGMPKLNQKQSAPMGPAIQITGLLGTFVDVRGSGRAGYLTQQFDDYVSRLIDQSGEAFADGSFYTAPFARQRAEIQRMIRLDNIATVAGPMLEGYLMGRTVPFSELGDTGKLHQNCWLLSIAEKPKKEWGAREYRAFIRQEKALAFQEAEALLTSLDRDKVQALVDEMVAEAQQGKLAWQGQELIPRIAALFSSGKTDV